MPTRRPSPHAPRRALTLIETVAAVVLLSILAAGVLGALSSIIAQQVRQQRRLQAVELANRLMLQYLDDPTTMPSRTSPVAYGRERFRWEINETPTRLVHAVADVAAERQQRSALVVDRIKAVSLRVWLSEESGGSFQFDPIYPTATLTRLVDPVAGLYRNPDTMDAILKDDARKRELLALLMPTEAGGLVNRPTRDQSGVQPSPRTTRGGKGDPKGGPSRTGSGKGGSGKAPAGRGRDSAPTGTGKGGGGK